MKRFAQMLGLPFEDILNLIDAYKGYAIVLERKESTEELLPWIASSWLISAIYQAIADPILAKPLFSKAALAYFGLNLPIWRVCAICADDEENILKRGRKSDIVIANASQQDEFYSLLEDFYNELRKQEQTFFTKKDFPNERGRNLKGKIDKLDIPYNFIVEVMEDSDHWGRDDKSERLQKFSELLRRIYELIELNKSDSYHWENLQGSIIPIEPVSISLIIIFLKKWLKDNSYSQLLEAVNFNEQQKMLLEIGAGLLNTSTNPE